MPLVKDKIVLIGCKADFFFLKADYFVMRITVKKKIPAFLCFRKQVQNKCTKSSVAGPVKNGGLTKVSQIHDPDHSNSGEKH